jgi:cell division septum initiation protein DivIVA
MTSQNSLPFKSVRHGYDPAEVERHIAELTKAATDAQQRADELAAQAAAGPVSMDKAGKPMPPVEPTFHDFGKRIGRILAMAEEEAEEMRTAAVAEVDSRLSEADEAAERTRREADAYATETRSAADEHATKLVEDARRAADQMADEAERMAIARSGEAEALYEEQRARAAKAAADFEQTLAARRAKSEQEFQERSDVAEKELDDARNRVA